MTSTPGRARPHSLRRRLLLVAALGMLLPALVLTYFRVTRSLDADVDLQVKRPLDQYTEVLSRGMAVAIWNQDRAVARELVAAVMNNPDVISITVLSEGQEWFADQHRTPAGGARRLRSERAILYNGTALGTVSMEMSVARVHRELAQDLLRQGFTLTAQGVLSLLLMWFLVERRILLPLRRLQEGTRRLARGVFGQPILAQYPDEIGELAIGMDLMRTDFAALIAEHKRTEAELARSDAHGRALISAIPDLIFINRRDGTYAAVHARDPGLLYTQEPILERSIHAILPAAIAERFEQAAAAVFSSGILQEFTYDLPIAGQDKNFEARVVPCTEDTVLTLVRDVTAKAQADRERQDLQTRLQQSQKMESLGSLAGGVAHDMNNVLAAILGLASAHLDQVPAASPTHRALETITKAASRGSSLVKTLLSFARQSPTETQVLDLHSEPGQGTRVVVRLPACDPAGAAERTAEPPVHRPEASLRVLLVDADELIAGAIRTMLHLLGHQVTVAESGEAALARLEAGDPAQVVILDMNMPGLGGLGTLPRLRALKPDLPVLLTTGRADQTALDLVRRHPRVTLLAKPFTLEELVRHLNTL